jgi:hypothetical protein
MSDLAAVANPLGLSLTPVAWRSRWLPPAARPWPPPRARHPRRRPRGRQRRPRRPRYPTAAPLAWPADTRSRLVAVRYLIRTADSPRSADELAAAFSGARRKEFRATLDSRAALGVVVQAPDGRFAAA